MIAATLIRGIERMFGITPRMANPEFNAELTKAATFLTLEGIVCGLDSESNDDHRCEPYDKGFRYGSRLRALLSKQVSNVDIAFVANQALRDIELET